MTCGSSGLRLFPPVLVSSRRTAPCRTAPLRGFDRATRVDRRARLVAEGCVNDELSGRADSSPKRWSRLATEIQKALVCEFVLFWRKCDGSASSADTGC